MIKKALSLFFALGILVVAGVNLLLAAPTDNVTVSPFLQNIRILPGETQKDFSLRVTNNASTAQTFTLSTVNFGSLDDTGGVVFEGGKNDVLIRKYGLASWIILPTNQLSLQTGESATVQGYINNDSRLTPGGHYGAVIVSSKAPASSGSTQVGINQKVSSLIFATKVGGEKYDLKLLGFTSNKALTRFPTTVTLNFRNDGNTQIVPRGVVSLVLGAKVIKRAVINEQSGLILPEKNRLFDVNLRSIGSDKFQGFGKYSLVVDYRYDGYDRFASKKQDSFIFSPSLIAFCLVLLGALVLAVVLVGKRVRSKKSKPVPKTKKSKK